MKTARAIVVVLLLVIAVLGVMLGLSTPKPWPISQGTLTVKSISVDGKPFVMIDGEPMNKLGQIQSINVELDPHHNKLVVERCLLRWNPFSRVAVNHQWPLFFSLSGMKPGQYAVTYKTIDGETTAGNFHVP